MTISKLTQLDRRNIDSLCRIFDSHFSNTPLPRSKSNTIVFERDRDALLSYGFDYGFSKTSLFGRDNIGRMWQIATVPTHSTAGKGCVVSTTTWYIVDDRGLRHKVHPIGWQLFYTLFPKPKKAKPT